MKRHQTTSFLLFYLCILTGTILKPTAALCGNARSFLLGDEAAMTGGAGVAIARDSGAIWYNPAGLGGLHYGRMELTATAYKLKLRRIERFVEVQLPGGTIQQDMNVNTFGAVPTSLVFVRNINDDISFGIALYQTGSFSETIRKQLDQHFQNGHWSLGLETNEQSYTYHVGPAVGWQLSPRFRIGASLFFIYDSYTSKGQEFLSLTLTDSSGESNYAYLWSDYFEAMAVGMKLQVGIQWEVLPRLHLGMVVRSPAIEFYYREKEITYDVTIDDEFENGAFSEQEEVDEWQLQSGKDIELQLALAYRTEKFWVGAEAAFRPPADIEFTDVFQRSSKWLWNASIGARHFASEKFNWGAGIFTDRSISEEPEWFLDENTDRYGITFGIETLTPLDVKSKNKEKKLIWTTTLALLYSFEIGEVLTLQFEDPFYGDFASRNVVFHEFLLHLGSSLYF
jgi:hypothetical protein